MYAVFNTWPVKAILITSGRNANAGSWKTAFHDIVDNNEPIINGEMFCFLLPAQCTQLVMLGSVGPTPPTSQRDSHTGRWKSASHDIVLGNTSFTAGGNVLLSLFLHNVCGI